MFSLFGAGHDNWWGPVSHAMIGRCGKGQSHVSPRVDFSVSGHAVQLKVIFDEILCDKNVIL